MVETMLPSSWRIDPDYGVELGSSHADLVSLIAVIHPEISRPQTGSEWLRWVGNYANLSTPFGLLVAKIGRAEIRQGARGLLLAEHYRLPFPVAGAFTIGNVITTSSTWAELLAQFPELLRHEERHAWQYLYCGGLPFYPLYGACLAWSMIRTGDRAARNFFERQAGLELGGYPDAPTRPVGVVLRGLVRRARPGPRSRS